MAGKMEGISVKLPLIYGSSDGPYILNKNLGEVVKQNFKNLLLTSPGERVMLPDFGIGLRNLLFEGISGTTYEKISARIREQTFDYMPFINIEEINFISSDEDQTLPLNAVRVSISFNLGAIDTSDTLSVISV